MGTKKILIAEDNIQHALVLKTIMAIEGHQVTIVKNGSDAIKILEQKEFDLLITDWMMPIMDGIELIRAVRKSIRPVPVIIMVTALSSDEAREHALDSGADDFIVKPAQNKDILNRINEAFERHSQPEPDLDDLIGTKPIGDNPDFVGVVIASSTGGIQSIPSLFSKIQSNVNAVFYIAQHGPAWMLESFAQRLNSQTYLRAQIATHNQDSIPGNIYIAPGDKHLVIEPYTYKMLLNSNPKENHVRPSADPLFRSAAEAFGHSSIAVVMTGLGRDGATGAAHISLVNGKVVVQDPATAIAPSMPQTVINAKIPCKVVPLQELGDNLSSLITLMQKVISKD